MTFVTYYARELSAESLARAAWIGDAVLALYARLKIVKEDNALDGPKSVRMTSNGFLSSLGEPTRVEAEIGLAFERGGLAAASQWMEEHLMPLFDKQEANRLRKSSGATAVQRSGRNS